MIIQSSINQGISLAALIASQNPKLQEYGKKQRALKDLGKREKALYKEKDILEEHAEVDAEEIGTYVAGKEAEIAEERYDIDPTAKNFQAVLEAKGKVGSIDAMMRARADEESKAAQDRLRETRRTTGHEMAAKVMSWLGEEGED